MHARQVDPRDQTLQVDDPGYRVCFWTEGSACEEWELTETDLDQVLSWVSQHANGRTHSLWAVLPRGTDVEVVRLRGIDPPAQSDNWPGWAVEVR